MVCPVHANNASQFMDWCCYHNLHLADSAEQDCRKHTLHRPWSAFLMNCFVPLLVCPNKVQMQLASIRLPLSIAFASDPSGESAFIDGSYIGTLLVHRWSCDRPFSDRAAGSGLQRALHCAAAGHAPAGRALRPLLPRHVLGLAPRAHAQSSRASPLKFPTGGSRLPAHYAIVVLNTSQCHRGKELMELTSPRYFLGETF